MARTFEQKLIRNVLNQDEFMDSEKHDPYYEAGFVRFANQHAGIGEWLDVGCGTGRAMQYFCITHAIEPNPYRRKAAMEYTKRVNSVSAKVYDGTAENLTVLFRPETFKTVSYFRGFFQCRSDFETLVSVNTVLKDDGIFLVDVPCEDHPKPIHGRHWTKEGFIHLMKQFGFRFESCFNLRLDADRLFAFRKVHKFGPETYNKPQLIFYESPAFHEGGKLYQVKNASSWAYWLSEYEDEINYDVVEHDENNDWPTLIEVFGEVPWELQ